MTISYVDRVLVEAASGAEAAAFTVTLPAGAVAGDLIVFNAMVVLNTAPANTPPAGAVVLAGVVASPEGSAAGGNYAWEIPSPKPASMSFSWNGTPRRGTLAGVVLHESTAGKAWDLISTAASWIGSSPTTKQLPTLTTTVAGAFLVGIVQQNSGSASIAAPSGWTDRTGASVGERKGSVFTRNTLVTSPGVVAAVNVTVAGAQAHRLQMIAVQSIDPPVPPVVATLMSEPFPGATGDVADGAAIVPAAGGPFVITTRKDVGGGLYVHDIDGDILSSVRDGAANSVDTRDLAGSSAWDHRLLAVTVDRDADLIRYYWMDRSTGALTGAGSTALAYEPYGSWLYVEAGTGNVYVFVTDRGADDFGTHSLRQYLLTRSGSTVTAGAALRTISVEGVMEGGCGDDINGHIFVSREDYGLFRYNAAVAGGSTATTVGLVGGDLVADVEDVAIARRPDGDKLIVSSQGDSSFHVYDLATLTHEMRFTVAEPGGTPVADTDGLDVYGGATGAGFPDGLLVVHTSAPNPSRFAYVDLGLILGELALTRVTKTAATAWGARARVEKAGGTAWGVSARMGKAAQSAWGVLTRLSRPTPLAWGFLAREGLTVDVAWMVEGALSRVVAPSQTGWGVRARASLPAGLAWFTLARTAGLRDVGWVTRERNVRPDSIAWGVRARGVGSRGTSWSTLERVHASPRATLWGMLARADREVSIAWNTLSSAERAVVAVATAWAARERASVGLSTRWGVLARLPVVRAVAWALLARSVRGVEVAWPVRVQASGFVRSAWDVRTRAARQGAVAWRVLSDSDPVGFIFLNGRVVELRVAGRVVSFKVG